MKQNELKVYYVRECFVDDERQSISITEKDAKCELLKDVEYFNYNDYYEIDTSNDGSFIVTSIVERDTVYVLRLVPSEDISKLFE